MPGLYWLFIVKCIVLVLRFSSHGSMRASCPYFVFIILSFLRFTTRYILMFRFLCLFGMCVRKSVVIRRVNCISICCILSSVICYFNHVESVHETC